MFFRTVAGYWVAYSLRISQPELTAMAPSRSSALLPLQVSTSILPGTTNTSRPCSAARRAVISAPLVSGASTTSTPLHKPLMIRFRLGKFHLYGGVPGGNSVSKQPQRSVSAYSDRLEAGYTTSAPLPSTPTTIPPFPKAPHMAMASTPAAAPETTKPPQAAIWLPIRLALVRP